MATATKLESAAPVAVAEVAEVAEVAVAEVVAKVEPTIVGGLVKQFAEVAGGADRAQTRAWIEAGGIARKYMVERIGKEDDSKARRSLRAAAVKTLAAAADWNATDVSRAAGLNAAADRWTEVAGLPIRKALMLLPLLPRDESTEEYGLAEGLDAAEVAEVVASAATATREEIQAEVDRLLGKEKATATATATATEEESEEVAEESEEVAEIENAADAALEVARLVDQFPGALRAAAPILPVAEVVGLIEGLAEYVRQNRDTNSQAAFGTVYRAAQVALADLRAAGAMPQAKSKDNSKVA